MIVSEQVEEWKDEGRVEGEIVGARKLLVRSLRNRFGTISNEMERSIRSIENFERIAQLMDMASIDPTIEAFADRLVVS